MNNIYDDRHMCINIGTGKSEGILKYNKSKINKAIIVSQCLITLEKIPFFYKNQDVKLQNYNNE